MTWKTTTAHPPKDFSPEVAYDATTMMGSDAQPTITVKRLKTGDVVVKQPSVTAEGMTKLEIKYTATMDLADPDPDGVATTEDATFGRVQITCCQRVGVLGMRRIFMINVSLVIQMLRIGG